jgi:hypothetical protein
MVDYFIIMCVVVWMDDIRGTVVKENDDDG